MLYELTFLGLRPNTLGAVMPKLEAGVRDAVQAGRLLGCFTCELGALNRVAILAGYDDEKAAYADRARLAGAANPYGFSEFLGSAERAVYKPFSFMPAIEPGAYGPVYEIRCYEVAAGGTQHTADAWAKVVDERQTISKILTAMTSTDIVPQKLIHIWPYESLNARQAARAEASKRGIWPPPGSGDFLLSLKSEIFLPTAFSPLK